MPSPIPGRVVEIASITWRMVKKLPVLEPISYGYILEKLVCLELYRMEINVTEFRRCADKIMHLIKNRS